MKLFKLFYVFFLILTGTVFSIHSNRSGNCNFCGRHYSRVKQHENHYCPKNSNRKKQNRSGNCGFCRQHYLSVKQHEKHSCPKNPNRKRKKRSQAGSRELCKQCPNLNLNLFERHRIKKPIVKKIPLIVKILAEKVRKQEKKQLPKKPLAQFLAIGRSPIIHVDHWQINKEKPSLQKLDFGMVVNDITKGNLQDDLYVSFRVQKYKTIFDQQNPSFKCHKKQI